MEGHLSSASKSPAVKSKTTFSGDSQGWELSAALRMKMEMESSGCSLFSFRRCIPPHAELVDDLSIGLSGSLGFRSRRGMADFLGGEAGRGTLKERFLLVNFNFGIVV